MCTCNKIILEQMLEKMKGEQGFTDVVAAPAWKNYSLYPDIKPYFPVVGKYLQGNRSRKFEISIYPTYCPFCGQKLE